jgi:hypothetical protein
MAAAIADVGFRVVAYERLVICASVGPFARLEDVLALDADKVRRLVLAAARRIGAAVAGLCARCGEQEDGDREKVEEEWAHGRRGS